MTAGLLQLVAKGEQDEYLTGNPQISFYRFAFKRHTNFAMETIEILFSDLVNWGSMSTCNIPQKGDLLSNMYIQIRLPRLSSVQGNVNARWVRYVGLALIKKVELFIGGQLFDTQSGEWIYVKNQLSLDSGKRNGFDYMVGFDVDPEEERTIFVPLSFWFNNHNGMALPLVSLSFHEVKLRVHFRTFNEVTLNAQTIVPISNVSILANYVYLDIQERKYFAKDEQEYIIEYVQHDLNNQTNNLNPVVDIPFMNPVKEIIWMAQLNHSLNQKDWFNFTYLDNKNPTKSAVIQINGNDRFSALSGEYFNLIQTYQHHSCIPDNAGLNVYSFAIFPEAPQPSGTMNFSRVDTAKLKLEIFEDVYSYSSDVMIKLYAPTYNVLTVKAGMACLKFAA